jgi:mannose-6-phosphate isomerase-like protein (cupin superfamily)
MEKVVTKPWGKEIWLAYPPDFPYVMKKIFTRAAYRSSVHVHKKKRETNYVLEGCGFVYTYTSNLKKLDSMEIHSGSVFHIHPNTIHRVEATQDLVTIEVSTPEVDDVIRLSDDTRRGDGRIESEH